MQRVYEAPEGYAPAIVLWEEQANVLVVAGDEDRTTQSRRRHEFSRAITGAPEQDVVVDLSGLTFADPSLMLDLAMVARRRRKAGKAMVVRGAQPQIAKLIELVGLDRLDGVIVAGAPRRRFERGE